MTYGPVRRYRSGMAQTYMVFDFGTNEELAQQARHKIEGWKQGFRLGEKMSMKFHRVAAEAAADGGKPAKKGKEGKEGKEAKEAADHVTVLVKLAFSGSREIVVPTMGGPHPHRRAVPERERRGGAGRRRAGIRKGGRALRLVGLTRGLSIGA